MPGWGSYPFTWKWQHSSHEYIVLWCTRRKRFFKRTKKKYFFLVWGMLKPQLFIICLHDTDSLSPCLVKLLPQFCYYWWPCSDENFFKSLSGGGGEYSQWSWNKKLGHKFKVIYPYCFKALGSVWQLAFHRLWGQLCQSPSGLTACFLYDQEDATYVEILLFCLNCNLVMNSLNKACW